MQNPQYMILLTSGIAARPTILLASAHLHQYTADTNLNHGILSDDRISVATGHRLGSTARSKALAYVVGKVNSHFPFISPNQSNQSNQSWAAAGLSGTRKKVGKMRLAARDMEVKSAAAVKSQKASGKQGQKWTSHLSVETLETVWVSDWRWMISTQETQAMVPGQVVGSQAKGKVIFNTNYEHEDEHAIPEGLCKFPFDPGIGT